MFIAFGIASPLIVNRILDNVDDPSAPSSTGYWWSFGLFVATVLRILAETHKFLELTRGSCTLRAEIQSVVYRKAIHISSSSRSGSSVGEIINLMQLDAESIGRFALSINALWSAPLQLIISVALLYVFIGPSSIVGLAATLLTIPIQSAVVRRVFLLRKKTMKITDERVKLSNEVLQGIKAVKFYAWEKPFARKIEDIRNREVSILQSTIVFRALFVVVISALPTLISVVTFAFYAGVFKNELDVASVFTAILLLSALRGPLLSLPFAVTAIIEAKVSVKRVERFLGFENTPPITRNDDSCEVGEIKVENGSFQWGDPPPPLPSRQGPPQSKAGSRGILSRPFRRRNKSATENKAGSPEKMPSENDGGQTAEAVSEAAEESSFSLLNVDIDIPAGQLTAIVGPVGAGKTSLLNAVLGEMKTVDGSVKRNGTVAYVPQTAWIYNGTLRDNVLFGQELDDEKYEVVVAASQLEDDLSVLPHGHETLIGEKGINLSGGQKQRVSIARTIYSDVDIYIFDDPLSALDARVGKSVFDECMSKNGLLRNKTRLLVTNQLQFLPYTDKIIVLSEGRVQSQGTFKELIEKDTAFQAMLSGIVTTADEDDLMLEPGSEAKLKSFAQPDAELTRGKSTLVSKGTLMSMEERKTGNVKGSLYMQYARLCGGLSLFIGALLISVIAAAVQVLPNWWLSYWSQQEALFPGQTSTIAFLGVYFAFGIGYVLLVFFRSVSFIWLAVVAARKLHENILKSVLSAPMSFFDVTPIGRILSRFSRDVAAADQQVPQAFLMMLGSLLSLIAAYVMIAIITPLFMAIAIPVTILYFLLQRFYNRTNIELKRLDSISKSPIYNHFAETLGGLTTIRAFDREDQFIEANVNHIDTNIRFFFAQNVTSRWFSLYLELLGSLLVLAAAIFGVMAKDSVFSGLIGLSLNSALQVTAFLGFSIRSITELEAQMNAVERLIYYCEELPSEAQSVNNDYRPPPEWPSKGKIHAKNLRMRYRPGLEPSLNGVSMDINPTERIGVVGRTGAGKSSLAVALLRLVEPYEGTLEIDDVDALKLGLEDLRSKITIIPQDPVIFSGTLRFNLDPFDAHTDQELWETLEKSSMKEVVADSGDGLEMNIVEYGGNLSSGQQQLLCLARALLRRPKILIMDEATSNVDYETDQAVQSTVRREFADSTILTIAHRLWTIADYDRILVMDNGEVAEFGTPEELLRTPNSRLNGLVNALGGSTASSFRDLISKGSNATPK
uniref:Probable ATP-dependent transporter ycf16 n=1 Tax=Rhodosorus marinus TaxID=101924 RepID=A0A7S0BN76_9RHOD